MFCHEVITFRGLGLPQHQTVQDTGMTGQVLSTSKAILTDMSAMVAFWAAATMSSPSAPPEVAGPLEVAAGPAEEEGLARETVEALLTPDSVRDRLRERSCSLLV